MNLDRRSLEKKFERERIMFPVLERGAYFITASTGLVPAYIHDAVQRYQERRYLIGGDAQWNGMSTMEMMEWSKKQLGSMLGCSGRDIAFGDNSSRMLNLMVQGLPLQEGDNVVVTDTAFLSTRFAWQLRAREGIEIKTIGGGEKGISPKDIFSAVDEHTKVISLSFVESSTGFRYDLGTIGDFCRARGILLCVDGVQGIGVMPLDVEKMKIDFLVGNDYKWMMGYCGTGFACISKELQERLKPWGAGWMSDDERFNTRKQQLALREDAGRFELGYPNVPGVYSLGLAAERYNRLGAEAVKAYVLQLREAFCQGIGAIKGAEIVFDFPPENRSQLVHVEISGRCRALSQQLAQQNVFIEGSFDKARDCFVSRIGLHYFNNISDINRLLSGIERRC